MAACAELVSMCRAAVCAHADCGWCVSLSEANKRLVVLPVMKHNTAMYAYINVILMSYRLCAGQAEGEQQLTEGRGTGRLRQQPSAKLNTSNSAINAGPRSPTSILELQARAALEGVLGCSCRSCSRSCGCAARGALNSLFSALPAELAQVDGNGKGQTAMVLREPLPNGV
eukprot:Tamp_21670.p1 GENE.Tamp_21670~~Tamp_21670.p1  ORF type:complete len:171 (-),score=2.21 Tamp_21670:469-981(-)